jgi:acyl-CoA synthetase (AMP-forming)/AMP-acid ligase II
MDGLMQDGSLNLQSVLRRMRTVNAAREVVTLGETAPRRATYGEVAARVDRLCAALAALGVRAGDRVASLSWNTQEHLELYLGVPAMGAVLHTLNLRLSDDQLAWIVNHAEDRVVVVDESLAEQFGRIAPRLRTVEHVLVTGEATPALDGALAYEDVLSGSEGFGYPTLPERQAAALCYTSGTTGDPKGVLYTHRSLVLHAMGVCMADSLGVASRDRVLPIVPMFHANAWGLAQAAPLTGADLVLPSRHVNPTALATAIERERVTLAAAVPTVWIDLLAHADRSAPDLSSLRTVICGGAAVPAALMRAFEERHGVRIIQAWGMTETSPIGAVGWPPSDVADGSDHAWRYRARTGRLVPLVDARVVDDEGVEQPWDGEATGELQVRGPWVAAGYYRADAPEKFDGEWLRTGDIAAIDERGYVQISDRAKDVIKSGGEWISSVTLENELMAHPSVREAAVIATPHERWSERPLACIVPAGPAPPPIAELAVFLAGRVPRWWLPDAAIFIDEVPKTSVGKFDKKRLRAQLEEGVLGEPIALSSSAPILKGDESGLGPRARPGAR